MDEKTIVEKLSPKVEAKADVTTQDKAGKFENILELAPLYGFFNSTDAEKSDSEYQEKMNAILEYFKKGTTGMGETLMNIKSQLSKMGNAGFTQDIDRLSRYVAIKGQIDDLEKQATSYEQ